MEEEQMKFDPATGEKNPSPDKAYDWREYHGYETAWLFNPWTGARRSAEDVGSDVVGLLIKPHSDSFLIGMKTESRVNPAYKKGTSDWEAEYDMLLDDGVTCGECNNSHRCKTIFGGDDSNTSCQFHPNRFSKK